MNSKPTPRVQLGYVAGVHGVRGAVRIKLFNPDSATLAPGLNILLCPRGKSERESDFESFEVARATPKPGSDMSRVWLAGVEGRELADTLRGREVWVDRGLLPALETDEFYLADLIGSEVVRRTEQGDESLGEVTDVTTNTVQELLCVRLRGREWLLPALPPFIVKIDHEAGRVVVDVHDDMLPESA